MSRIILTNPVYVSGRDCGYCHGEKSEHYATDYMKKILPKESQSITIGSSVQSMDCQDYDDFINMGFRRSGSFLYKTDMLRSCCRYYTIRTNLSHLKVEKKHRQVINRFIKAIENLDSDQLGKDNGHKKGKPFNLNDLIEAENKSSRFHTRFEPSKFTQEKFDLYKKYQTIVHNDSPDEVSEEQFERFLCESLFEEEEIDGHENEWTTLNNWVKNAVDDVQPTVQRIGPTHECYFLDGKLIAFSVMDFLPSGISSVYFVWDPDYANLSLGTLSGLREMIMVDKLGLDYYYLGYYIEDCPKMIYKGKFGGELLDLCNETYFPLSQVKPFIQKSNLFLMGTKTQFSSEINHEIEMSNSYPDGKTDKEARLGEEMNYNIIDKVYNDKMLNNAKISYDKLSTTFKLPNNKFPNVIPGLIPVTQLENYVKDNTIRLIRVAFFNMITGEFQRDKLFDNMTYKEKLAMFNCIRLYGFDKISRIIIMLH